jgi:hypothetical protein
MLSGGYQEENRYGHEWRWHLLKLVNAGGLALGRYWSASGLDQSSMDGLVSGCLYPAAAAMKEEGTFLSLVMVMKR